MAGASTADAASVWWLDDDTTLGGVESACAAGSARCVEGLFGISVIEFTRDIDVIEQQGRPNKPARRKVSQATSESDLYYWRSYTKNRLTQPDQMIQGCSHKIFRTISTLQRRLRETHPLDEKHALYSRVLARQDASIVTPVDVIHIESYGNRLQRETTTKDDLVTARPTKQHVFSASEDSPPSTGGSRVKQILATATRSTSEQATQTSPPLSPARPPRASPRVESRVAPEARFSRDSDTRVVLPREAETRTDSKLEIHNTATTAPDGLRSTPLMQYPVAPAEFSGAPNAKTNIQIKIGGSNATLHAADSKSENKKKSNKSGLKSSASSDAGSEKLLSPKRRGRPVEPIAEAEPFRVEPRANTSEHVTEDDESRLETPLVSIKTPVRRKGGGTRSPLSRLKHRIPALDRKSQPVTPREFTEIFEYIEEETLQFSPQSPHSKTEGTTTSQITHSGAQPRETSPLRGSERPRARSAYQPPAWANPPTVTYSLPTPPLSQSLSSYTPTTVPPTPVTHTSLPLVRTQSASYVNSPARPYVKRTYLPARTETTYVSPTETSRFISHSRTPTPSMGIRSVGPSMTSRAVYTPPPRLPIPSYIAETETPLYSSQGTPSIIQHLRSGSLGEPAVSYADSFLKVSSPINSTPSTRPSPTVANHSPLDGASPSYTRTISTFTPTYTYTQGPTTYTQAPTATYSQAPTTTYTQAPPTTYTQLPTTYVQPSSQACPQPPSTCSLQPAPPTVKYTLPATPYQQTQNNAPLQKASSSSQETPSTHEPQTTQQTTTNSSTTNSSGGGYKQTRTLKIRANKRVEYKNSKSEDVTFQQG
eukprot:Blabericola_migrator_1__1421@NODE_1372_length_4700_cov_152_201381_g921_i0_p1_GENE_NODE_1372_length_4700_cov_152_201381_g921_i0NODE_1372_length_4700_cov_152_201381_g921_i0_p1_ORF_typecomplete_len822_score91_78_NODE_1372_length_4700_cov_152_201381_g921_i02582723